MSPLQRLCFLTLFVSLGCTAPSAGESETGALLASEEASNEGLAFTPLRMADAGEVLLEERSDGARMFGRLLGGLIATDEEPVWALRTELHGQPIEPSLEGAHVRDATFLPNGLLTIGEDHVLRSHVHGVVVELDAEALGPLSVAGNRVAYVRGSMPFYELAVADLEAGTAAALTTDMAPVWSPALSPDGRDVVFVSGVTGAPRLYLLSSGSAPLLLPESGAFPSSLSVPRFDGSTLTFEDESGQPHVVSVPR